MGAEARLLRIAAIGGDGIGPEVVAASLPVLERAARLHGARLEVESLDWGGERFLRVGRACPADAAQRVRSFDAVLFGAVGHPEVPDHELIWDLIIRLRQELGADSDPEAEETLARFERRMDDLLYELDYVDRKLDRLDD